MNAFFLFIVVTISLSSKEAFAAADTNRLIANDFKQGHGAIREFCTTDQESLIPIEIKAPNTTTESQVSCNKAYFFEITDQLAGFNVMIEITLTSKAPDREKFRPFLAVRKNERPKILRDGITSETVVADGFDSAGLNYSSNYHHYLIKKNSIAKGDKIYFAFYQRDGGPYTKPILYTINITKHSDFPCPHQCSNQGNCDNNRGICTCYQNFYMPDCSEILNKHEIDMQYNVTLVSNDWYYFYIDRSQALESDLNLRVQVANESRVAIILRYQNRNLRLPSEYFFHYIYRVRQDNTEAIMSISPLDLVKLGPNIVVGIKNQGKDSFLSIKTETKKRSPHYIVYLITGGILTMVFGLLFWGLWISERKDKKTDYGGVEADTVASENQKTVELAEVSDGEEVELHFNDEMAAESESVIHTERNDE